MTLTRVPIVAITVGFGLLTISAASMAAQQKPSAPRVTAKAPVDPAAALPGAIKTAFKTAYPNATIKHVSKETEKGVMVYEVESIDAGLMRDLIYKADGTVVSYEEQIAESAVPGAVSAAIKARYPKATVSVREKAFQGGTVSYEFVLKGAPVTSVELTPDGKWISPKAGK
ncbi:MAG TPA: PepSY-like domain-containing protein [Vicinamibacterales bacterium]|nr:PepSY-like domain-containing protein [Vicinamibacterales bacterium]